MTDEQRSRVLPELVRFANDPKLDGMTRTWVFDALRDITNQKFGDDGAVWRAWYIRVSGSRPVHPEDYWQQLTSAAAWLP